MQVLVAVLDLPHHGGVLHLGQEPGGRGAAILSAGALAAEAGQKLSPASSRATAGGALPRTTSPPALCCCCRRSLLVLVLADVGVRCGGGGKAGAFEAACWSAHARHEARSRATSSPARCGRRGAVPAEPRGPIHPRGLTVNDGLGLVHGVDVLQRNSCWLVWGVRQGLVWGVLGAERARGLQRPNLPQHPQAGRRGPERLTLLDPLQQRGLVPRADAGACRVPGMTGSGRGASRRLLTGLRQRQQQRRREHAGGAPRRGRGVRDRVPRRESPINAIRVADGGVGAQRRPRAHVSNAPGSITGFEPSWSTSVWRSSCGFFISLSTESISLRAGPSGVAWKMPAALYVS